MKKIFPYIFGSVVLIVVLFAINPHYFNILFSYFSPQETDIDIHQTVQNTSPVVSFKTITDKDNSGRWTFKATYPVFDNTLGKKFSAINSQIEAEIQVIKLQTTDSVSGDISPENKSPSLTPFEITLTSDATTSEKFGTVSVLYSTFVDGGLLAHPYTNFESHTFSSSDGTEKTLKDFFNASDFFSNFSKKSTEELKKYYFAVGNSDTSFLDNNEGLVATSSNFKIFMLTDSDIILQFEEYQLGSRPYGAPRIEISI